MYPCQSPITKDTMSYHQLIISDAMSEPFAACLLDESENENK
jgi:hypothetical protein